MMTGSCDAKQRSTRCHFSEVRGNIVFNILLVSSCSTKKKKKTSRPMHHSCPIQSLWRVRFRNTEWSLEGATSPIQQSRWIQRQGISVLCSVIPQELLFKSNCCSFYGLSNHLSRKHCAIPLKFKLDIPVVYPEVCSCWVAEQRSENFRLGKD